MPSMISNCAVAACLLLSGADAVSFLETTQGATSKSGQVLKTYNNGKCKLRKVFPEDLADEMLKPLMRMSGDKGKQKMWEKAGIPTRMRGIWWHGYTTTVNTFLYDRACTKPPCGAGSFRNAVGLGSDKTVVDLSHANAWSSFDQESPLKAGKSPGSDQNAIKDYEQNRANTFKYVFNFDKLEGSKEWNWANVSPSYKGHTLPEGNGMIDFAMFAEKSCANCRKKSAKNPNAGSAFSTFSFTERLGLHGDKAAQTCQDYRTEGGHVEPAENQCWGRISKVGAKIEAGNEKTPLAGFRYDVVKVVDEYGDKIQPNFDNWVAALKITGRSYVLLPEGDCA